MVLEGPDVEKKVIMGWMDEWRKCAPSPFPTAALRSARGREAPRGPQGRALSELAVGDLMGMGHGLPANHHTLSG